MKARGLLVVTTAIALMLFLASVASAGGRIAHRQIHQHKRIAQGVRSGAITGGEFVRLQREQGRIQGAKKRVWSDGTLSPREHHHLAKMQDRASKHIYRAEHNRRAYSVPQPHPRPYDRRVHHRSKYHHYRPRRVHHDHYYTPPRYGSYFSGTIAQPGWCFGWSVDLD